METRTLSFVVAPNESTDRREGRIVFTDGNLKEVVSIYQGAAKAPEKPDPRILLSKKDITIESKGGTVKVEAVSGKNVSIKIPEGYGWIQEGNKESTNTFYLTVSENSSLDNREGFVSFTDAESGFSENVNILQLSKDAIVVSKSSYSFGLEGGTLAMEVVSNMQVDASSDADWLSLAKSKAVDSQLVFSIAGAEAGTDRTGVITLRSGSAVQKISVRQFPMDSPIVFECKAVKDRLVELFDADCDGELSYKEAAEVTTLMNVFTDSGEPSVNLNSITAFDELQYFTGLKEIAPFAFAGTERLNKITLPSGVKVIGEYAFSAVQLGMESYEQGIRGLDTIILPEGLEEIGRYAFAGRPLNNGVVFPSTLKTIEREAFRNCCYYPNGNAYDVNVKCIGLKKIILPETVERIDYAAFRGCQALESVEIPSSIRNISSAFEQCIRLKSIAGSALSKDGSAIVNRDGVLLFLIGGKKNDYSIPEGVRRVSPSCKILYLNDGVIPCSFGTPSLNIDGTPLTREEQDMYVMKTLTIPSSFERPANNEKSFGMMTLPLKFKGYNVTPDGKGLVIDNCLIKVAMAEDGFAIPSYVTEIAYGAFSSTKIKEVIIPDSVCEIGENAFAYCVSLKSVKLPKNYTRIVNNMFEGCSNLINIDGIENVTEIGDGGLLNCGKLLARFKVPASVRKLGYKSLSASRSVIEFQSLVPPRIVNPDNKNDASPFHFGAMIYVPDITYKRYHEANYGWNNIETRKLSELYATPVFHTREFDKQNSLGENRHVLRITEEGKDEDKYHYDFIKVEAGSFKRKVQGTPSETVAVNITKDYYIAATEFPQWLWIDMMHFNPSNFTNSYINYFKGNKGEGDFHEGESDFRPVECVSWEDCNAFLHEFNKLTGLSMRLPTEAEWEYAAQGGKYSRNYAYSGSNKLGDVAWSNYNSNRVTHPCGLKLANELGLYDMHGNVWEYCQDFYKEWNTVDSIPSGDDPAGPKDDELNKHVIRGGGYVYAGYSYYEDSNGRLVYVEDGFIGVRYDKYNRGNRSYTTYGNLSIGFRPAI